MQRFLGMIGAALGAVFCAALSVMFVLRIFPDSSADWNLSTIVDWTWALMSPLVLILWAVVAGPSHRIRAFGWARWSIVVHFVLAIPFVLVAFVTIGPHAYQYVSLLGIAIPVDLLLLLLGPRASSDSDVLRLYRSCLISLSLGTLTLLFAWSFATIALVVWRAEVVGADRPYCLQISKDDEGHYRPVTSLLDLSGLRLRAPVRWSIAGSPGGRFNFHAVLVGPDSGEGPLWNGETFERGQWNWSNASVQFVPIKDYRRVRRVCTAKPHFASELPIISDR